MDSKNETQDEQSRLISAIFEDDLESVRLLLKNNVNCEQSWNGIFPINLAAKENKKEIAKALIMAKCNLDVQDPNGCFPLMDAVMHADEELIILLLENGANIDLQDLKGWTALMLSAYMGNDTWRILTRYGPNRDLKNEEGQTALDIGIQQGTVTSEVLRK